MAEVGVLELKIKDNSTAAGTGLSNLAKGLTAVKEAMTGFNLSPVGQEVQKLATIINGQKGASTAIKNLSGLFNAVAKFNQIKDFKIDVAPFEALRNAVKDGFKIGQAGTQLNQLRVAMTGDWGDGSGVQVLADLHTAAQNLSGDAEGIKATTDAIKEAAASLKSINSYSNAAAGSDWRMGMSGVSEGKSAGSDVANGMAEGVEQNKSVAVAAAVALAQAIIEAAKSTLEIASPSKVMQQIGEYAGEGLTEGLLSKQPGVEQAATSISDTIANAVSKFKTSEFNRFTAPVENLTNTFISLNKAQEAYASGIDAVLPKIQAMSSEEMIVAGNAKQAQDAIERIVERLNKPIKYKNLADMINASQGIGKQPLDAEYSAQVFAQMQDLTQAQDAYNKSLEGMDKQPFSGVVKVFDQAVGAYREIEGATNTVGEKFDQLSNKAQEVSSSIEQARQSAINLADIPATGMNGTFNNAAEELTYLTEKIEEAKNSMQFWADTYEKTQKQIKFNGPSEERTNMLQHSEEGFYAAAQSMETYQAAMNDTQAALANYIANMQTATQTVTEQVAATQAAASAVQQVNSSMDSYALTAQANANRTAIEMLFNALENPPVFRTDEYINQLYGFNSGCKSAEDSMRAFMEAMEGTSAISERLRIDNPELSGLVNEMNNAGVSAREFTDKLVDVDGELKQKKPDAEQAASGFKKFKDGIKSVIKPLTNLLKRLKNLIIMRSLRYLIREVAKGFSEGVNNVYEYSKAVGNSFGPAMDSIKSTLETMKNSVGAAVAPVLNALIPILNNLASAAITCFNYVNQLFSLLTGQSYWVKATEGAADYTKEAKKAGGATKEWLASFDELNVMSSGGGGGGGGKAAADYASMFENVTAFDEKIRKIAEFIKDNMESIKDLAIAAGAAILAWKLGNAFASTLPTLSTILGYVATGAAIAITLQLNWMFMDEYLDTKDEGWLWTSVLTTAVGSTAAAAIASKLIGGAAGSYAAAITLLLSAATDIVVDLQHTNVDALSKESLFTSAKAALEGGAGIGILAHASGAGLAGTLMSAGGAAFITFGVAMGLKAISDAKYTEFEPKSAILKSLLSAAPIGIGLGLFGTPIGLALLGTFATFVAVLAIQAAIPKQKITWGTVALTEKEVQAFVDQKMFNVDVKATVNMIAEKLEVTGTAREQVQEKLITALKTFKVIQLGLAESQDYAQMREDVGALIEKINGFIKEAKDANKLVLQYTPTLVGDNDVETGAWYTNSNQGWDTIQKFVEEKGKLIGDWLTSQEKKKIKDETPALIKEAMEQLTAVSEAISKAKVNAQAFAGLNITLGDLDEQSFTDVIAKFNQYKDELTKAYTDMANEAYQNQAAMVEALKISLGDDFENDAEYQAALAKLKYMGENLAKSIEDGVNSATVDGQELIRDWMKKQFQGSIKSTDWEDLFVRQGVINGEDISTALRNILENNLEEEQIQLADLVGFTGWDMLSDELKKGFMQYIDVFSPEQLGWLAQAQIPVTDVIALTDWSKFTEEQKKNLIGAIVQAYGANSIAALKSKFPDIKASDILNIKSWNTFTNTQKFEFLSSIKSAFGAKEAIAAAKNAGINIEELVRQGMQSKDEDLRKQASAWNDIIGKELGEEHKIKVGKDEESTKTASTSILGSVSNIINNFWADVKAKIKAGPVGAQKPQAEMKDVIEIKDSNNAIGKETQNQLKTSVEATTGTVKAKVNAAEVVDVDYKSFVKENKKDWGDSIDRSYDTNEAHQKAKKAGNNIGDNIKAGMSEKNSIVETQAQEWWDLIDGKLKVEHIIKIKEDKINIANVKQSIKDDIEQLRPFITVGTKFQDNALTSLVKNVEGLHPTVTAGLTAAYATFATYIATYTKPTVTASLTADYSGFKGKIQDKVKPSITSTLSMPDCSGLVKHIQDNTKPSVTVSLVAGSLTTFTTNVKSAIVKAINGITIKIAGENVSISAYRNGGLVNSGDIFIANENGKAEMIGRFGNQTAVANQEQMVEAMARGVQYANAEQNGILRTQNELLRAILQKENTLKIGASTALGRVARQSIHMYENAAGV